MTSARFYCGFLDPTVQMPMQPQQLLSARVAPHKRLPEHGRNECRDPLSENVSRKKAVFFEEVGIEDDAPGSLQKVGSPRQQD